MTITIPMLDAVIHPKIDKNEIVITIEGFEEMGKVYIFQILQWIKLNLIIN